MSISFSVRKVLPSTNLFRTPNLYLQMSPLTHSLPPKTAKFPDNPNTIHLCVRISQYVHNPITHAWSYLFNNVHWNTSLYTLLYTVMHIDVLWENQVLSHDFCVFIWACRSINATVFGLQEEHPRLSNRLDLTRVLENKRIVLGTTAG